jgi:benzoate/toluate 1,2-dioxygenase alpha subunit
MNTINKEYLDGLLEHNVQAGLFRHNREAFTNSEIFELEMKYIFENNWVFLAHESQVTEKNDYFSTYIGRQPIFISRNKDGVLNAFINACSHRGAMICRHKKGNKSTFTCPFHGWTFNNSGKLLKVKDPTDAGYPEQFNCDGSHDLKKLGAFESYRGFLFGSINANVAPLSEHLGQSKIIIDQIVDQAKDGLEVLRGSSSYIYNGNWKLQLENGADGYHVTSVHWNYVATMGRRKYENNAVRTVDATGWNKNIGGVYSFENGHMLLWTRLLNPEVRPVYKQLSRLNETFGEKQADFMVNQTRNLCLYPNVYLMDQFSTQIRVVRPVSVDRTEVTIYCFAPKNEDATDRATRIRQYEDFFNVSGMGTPDDLEEFRSCQNAYDGHSMKWNDISRGAAHWIEGADENASQMGLDPLLTGTRPEDEGLFLMQQEHWLNTLKQALDNEELVIV